MTVLVAIALPMYLKSVDDSEAYGCKTNMHSVAAAEQANKVRTGGTYWTGTVDATSTSPTGNLRDLNNALPHCPGDPNAQYSVASDGADGFTVRCSNPKHHFQWHNGRYEPY